MKQPAPSRTRPYRRWLHAAGLVAASLAAGSGHAQQAPPQESTPVQRVLEIVNQMRAQARPCGDRKFEAAPPLRRSEQLDAAALAHLQDMAGRGFFELRGSDGSLTADRAARAGYRSTGIGESLGHGAYGPDALVAGWLADPAPCANIMHPAFVDVGLARVPAADGRPGWYLWSMVVGRPR